MYKQKFGDEVGDEFVEKDSVSWVVHRGAPPSMSDLLESVGEVKDAYKQKFGAPAWPPSWPPSPAACVPSRRRAGCAPRRKSCRTSSAASSCGTSPSASFSGRMPPCR